MAQFHLFKHSNGKFDVAYVSKGRMVWDTQPQNYERKAGCYKAIRSLLKKFKSTFTDFQDDTFLASKVFWIGLTGKIEERKNIKGTRKYVPKSKKK